MTAFVVSGRWREPHRARLRLDGLPHALVAPQQALQIFDRAAQLLRLRLQLALLQPGQPPAYPRRARQMAARPVGALSQPPPRPSDG